MLYGTVCDHSKTEINILLPVAVQTKVIVLAFKFGNRTCKNGSTWTYSVNQNIRKRAFVAESMAETIPDQLLETIV